MFTTGSADDAASDEEWIPITGRWPVTVPDETGKPERFGWLVATVGETGIGVLHTLTREIRQLNWEALYQFNPTFNVEAVLAEVGVAPEAAPEPEVRATQMPVRPKAQPVAAAPRPATPGVIYRLTVGRPIEVPAGDGFVEETGWLIAAVGADAVTVRHPEGQTSRDLSWGQVLWANPSWLPPNTRIRMSNGRLGLFKGLDGEFAVVEGAASFDDPTGGLRSSAYVDRSFSEPIDVMAARNAERIG
ncbi:MAG: hypothetical protein H7338_03850 [Candidatus Sericytochromatia bacterium]|nr:hypothetical protein [Candidatus Sericytochromatia bacterium]